MSQSSTTPRQPGEVLRHLERLLDREDHRLDSRRTELGEVRDAIRALTHDLANSPVVHHADLEVVPAEHAEDVIGVLLDEAGQVLLRNSTMTVDYGPGVSEDRIKDAQRRMEEGMRMVTIYPLSVLDTAAGRRWIGAWAEAGEEQRFVAEPPSEFLILGDSAVIACSQWCVPDSDYVVIREPMLVGAFIALHERTYASAVPLGREGGQDVDARLIDLMSLGLKDESIARTLGSSLRTVRRRIAALMDEQGVDTRFQLGAALQARGRLEAGPLPVPLPPARLAPARTAGDRTRPPSLPRR